MRATVLYVRGIVTYKQVLADIAKLRSDGANTSSDLLIAFGKALDIMFDDLHKKVRDIDAAFQLQQGPILAKQDLLFDKLHNVGNYVMALESKVDEIMQFLTELQDDSTASKKVDNIP